MTDADYHSWRKPITPVITAPSGFLWVEWNALQNSLCNLLTVFCISVLIPSVWALIAQSMGPTQASEPSTAPMSLLPALQSREVMPFEEADELQSPLFVFLYSRQRLFIFIFGAFLKLIFSVLEQLWNEYFEFCSWGVKTAAVIFCETEWTEANQKFVLLGFASKTDLLQDWKRWDHRAQRCICRMYKDYRSSRVTGERPLLPLYNLLVILLTLLDSRTPVNNDDDNKDNLRSGFFF